MPYDIRRLQGFAGALLAVVVGLVCHGLVLRATLGQMGPWITLRNQSFNVVTSPEGALKRVLGLKRDLGAGIRPAPGERLGILIGSSTLRQGIDPAILDAEVGQSYRWTNVYTVAHAHEITLVIRAMFQFGVKPGAVGLVVNPAILVADGDREAERGWYDPGPFLQYLKNRKLALARGELVSLTMVPWHLAFPYRGQVFTMVDRGLFQAKLSMLEGIGQGLKALAAPEADPWLNPYPPDLGEGNPDPAQVGNANVLKYIGIKGWYDPESYRTDGPNFASLKELFRTAHEHKAKTFIVFVPESSSYRARLPNTATDHFKGALTDALGEAAPMIFDFRESAPDEDFTDVNHLNPTGREHLSHRLAETLKRSLGEGAVVRPNP
jgi:hypothetical protein